MKSFFTISWLLLATAAVNADHVIQWRSDIANTAYVNVTMSGGRPDKKHTKTGINKGMHTAAKSSPLVLADGETFLQPGDSGILYRLDIKTGEPLWAAAQLRISNFGYHSTPCAVYTDDPEKRDLAVIGSYDGIIGAFDLDTGLRLWETQVGHHIGASPTCTTQFVYIAVEFSNPPAGGVCKLAIHTGEIIWCEYGMGSHSHSTVGVDYENKVVVAGSNDDFMYVYRESDGVILAKYKAGKIKGPILIWKRYAIFGSWDYNIHAIDISHLHVDDHVDKIVMETVPKYKWPSIKTEKIHMSGVAIDPETELLYTGGHDNIVRCIDFHSGEVKWEHTTDNYVLSSPIVLNNAILVGSSDGLLYALEKATGKRIWRFLKGKSGKITSSPDISKDGRYIMYATDSESVRVGNKWKGIPGASVVLELGDANQDKIEAGRDEL